MSLPVGSTWTFEALVSGRSSGGNSAGYKITGVIKNGSGVTALVGSATTTVIAEDVGSWDAVASADNTNDALAIKVTGDNSTIRWVATVLNKPYMCPPFLIIVLLRAWLEMS